MSYISPHNITSNLIRGFALRSKRLLTESERSLISNASKSISLTAFNFNPLQISLTLYHFSQMAPKSSSHSCFYPLIYRFLTFSNSVTDPSLTLPILHAINHSKIIVKPSDNIYRLISTILRPEIITTYLNSILDAASTLHLIESVLSRGWCEGKDKTLSDEFNSAVLQVLEHYSKNFSPNNFIGSVSKGDALASLATLVLLSKRRGTALSHTKVFLPYLLNIDSAIFPKHTLIDLLEFSAEDYTFNELSIHILNQLSSFDDLNDFPRTLLQRVLVVAAAKNWKVLKFLDNITRVLCETSHSNIGISSIIIWLEAFKKLNYQNKSALELLLRQALNIPEASEKYPKIYQLFKELQFDHFLLSRLEVLTAHQEEIKLPQAPPTVKNIPEKIKPFPIEPLRLSKIRPPKAKPVLEVDAKRENKLHWKIKRNRELVRHFWEKKSKLLARRRLTVDDLKWRLLQANRVT